MPTMEETGGFCRTCNTNVLARRPGVNHVLHAVISIFSCGLWALFVWLPLTLGGTGKTWLCSRCGQPIVQA